MGMKPPDTCKEIKDAYPMMNPLWQSLPMHGRKGLILASLILGMSTTIGHATTIEQISLNKEDNGKLHINVNVSGSAAEFKPQEQ